MGVKSAWSLQALLLLVIGKFNGEIWRRMDKSASDIQTDVIGRFWGRALAIRIRDLFDGRTFERAQDYVRRDLVRSVRTGQNGVILGEVGNGRGQVYRQEIEIREGPRGGFVEGNCSCPVGHNCKHVLAVVMAWSARVPVADQPGGLVGPVGNWVDRLNALPAELAKPEAEARPEAYPVRIKDRLLFVLETGGASVKVATYKGRVNAAGTALNKAIRRYDVDHLLRGSEPAKFIRPLDLELLADLVQSRLWDTYGYHRLPDLLRQGGRDCLPLLRRLCETGRFLHVNSPDAVLSWSERRLQPQLGWDVSEDGRQRLGFRDAAGERIEVLGLEGAGVWLDTAAGQIGALDGTVPEELVHLVSACPSVAPGEVPALARALPERLGPLPLPRPGAMRQVRRRARARQARLILGAESARQGGRYYGNSVKLPVLTLRFLYDGQEAGEAGEGPRVVEGDAVVTLERDPEWETACRERLMEAAAIPVEELEFHNPGERMWGCDFAFADGEFSLHLMVETVARDALDFAFRAVAGLTRDGWEIEETAKWPFRMLEEDAQISVETRAGEGAGFQGHDWFSLGFSVEIGGRKMDVAPLVAAFLEQFRGDAVPEVEALRAELEAQPIFLERGKGRFAAIDLSPLAQLLHLFLRHHAGTGAMHPTEALLAAQAAEALAGSEVRFADNAGILTLARSLAALAEATGFAPPSGLRAQLRDYQALGAAWMGSLIEAGFGGVLADDMGLGKTIQVLALLQARIEAGRRKPVLLIVPTSLLHSWQVQAAQFTPDLRLLVLHGSGRMALREGVDAADLVITTYPLLARDREYLASRDWDLVIIDEAQVLKNPASQMAKALREIPAGGRLALTGTPLENSLQDLWTLMDWVVPGLLGDRKTFVKHFRTPIEKHGEAAAQARLNRRLRPFLLRRTKEQVAAELPPRTEIVERVELPKAQQALYETVRSAMDARVREAIGARGLAASRITILDALLKLRQVCCDPALVKSDAAREVTESAKRARLRELLAELVAEGRRVLVFSQFVEMLRLIEADLEAAGIAHLSLTGQTRDRAAVLEEFAKGDASVFLLSLKAGGVGLTLTEADTVILYDPWWNPAVERQAMDRTHRIGQDKPVFVHRLVAQRTVEEKILEMQARKQALADALFDAETGGSDPLLDETTLTDLFAPLEA